MAEPLLYTPEEAAAALRIGRTRMYQLIAAGHIASVKLGASRRISRQALEDFVSHIQREPVTARRQDVQATPPLRRALRRPATADAACLPFGD